MAELHRDRGDVGIDLTDFQEHEGTKVRWFKYVRYSDIEQYQKHGWVISGELGLPHNQYAILMENENGRECPRN